MFVMLKLMLSWTQIMLLLWARQVLVAFSIYFCLCYLFLLSFVRQSISDHHDTWFGIQYVGWMLKTNKINIMSFFIIFAEALCDHVPLQWMCKDNNSGSTIMLLYSIYVNVNLKCEIHLARISWISCLIDSYFTEHTKEGEFVCRGIRSKFQVFNQYFNYENYIFINTPFVYMC